MKTILDIYHPLSFLTPFHKIFALLEILYITYFIMKKLQALKM